MPIHRTSLIAFVTILSACSLILAGPGPAEESATPPAATQPARKYELVCKYPPGQYVVQRTATAGEGFRGYVFKQVMGLTIAPPDGHGDRRVTLQIERLQTYSPGRRVWDSDDPPKQAAEAGVVQHYNRPLLKVPLTAVVDAW